MSQLTETMGQPVMGGTHALCVGVRPRGFTRMAGTSRMNREVHVRNCGGLEVKFLRSTRLALRSCKGDGGRPSGVALQGEAPNRLTLLGGEKP